MAEPIQETRTGQLRALLRLWFMAQGDHGGAMVVRRVLLSLYNGRRFPIDLTDLRRLDAQNFQDCLAVMVLDYQPAMEVHVWIGKLLQCRPVGPEFEQWAYDMRLAGRCKKFQLTDLANLAAVPRVAAEVAHG